MLFARRLPLVLVFANGVDCGPDSMVVEITGMEEVTPAARLESWHPQLINFLARPIDLATFTLFDKLVQVCPPRHNCPV